MQKQTQTQTQNIKIEFNKIKKIEVEDDGENLWLKFLTHTRDVLTLCASDVTLQLCENGLAKYHEVVDFMTYIRDNKYNLRVTAIIPKLVEGVE